MKSRLCILEIIKPLKMILDFAMASKMKLLTPKTLDFFTPKMIFIQIKTLWSLRGTKPFQVKRFEAKYIGWFLEMISLPGEQGGRVCPG